jgi:hypothetical protein
MLKRIGGGCWSKSISKSISDLEPQLPPDGVFKDLSRKPWRILECTESRWCISTLIAITVMAWSPCLPRLAAGAPSLPGADAVRERGKGWHQEETRPATEQRDRPPEHTTEGEGTTTWWTGTHRKTSALASGVISGGNFFWQAEVILRAVNNVVLVRHLGEVGRTK